MWNIQVSPSKQEKTHKSRNWCHFEQFNQAAVCAKAIRLFIIIKISPGADKIVVSITSKDNMQMVSSQNGELETLLFFFGFIC